MKQKKYKIFISYRRRDTADKAEFLKKMLEDTYGRCVSFDRENLTGIFDVELIRRIDSCEDFLIVVGADTFNYSEEDCSQGKVEFYKYLGTCSHQEFDSKIAELGPNADIDFVRIEVVRALNNSRVHVTPIVPERTSDYCFSNTLLPSDLADLKRREAVTYSESPDALFERVMPSLKKHVQIRRRSSLWFSLFLMVLLISGLVVGCVFMKHKHEKENIIEAIEQTEISKAFDLLLSRDASLPELKAVANILDMMEYFEGGFFMLGAWCNADGEYDTDVNLEFETPARPDTVESFWMSHAEITCGDWYAIMVGVCSKEDRMMPVFDVSYDDCCMFANRLKNLTGLNFAVPTESEWEYAARGGVKQLTTKYAGSDSPEMVAWYASNSGGHAHACDGTKYSNGGNLFDMSGNLYEWTSTPFQPFSGDTFIPDSDAMTIRGGSYASPVSDIRVTYRDLMNRHTTSPEVGVRLVIRKYAE